VISKSTSFCSESSITLGVPVGPRVARFHKQQQRAERMNYLAVAVGVLVAVYVLVTIVRPLFFSTRPGKVTQDFGCISKATVSDCSASSR
jgi:hypothetical protein